MLPPLVPAEPAETGDGIPFSKTYNDVYHTAHGGLAQARHVFLGGNDLPARWSRADTFVIFETGFGLGLNFLATWHAWRESRANGRLHFISTEKHPFRPNDLARLLAPHTELSSLAGELLRQWPPLVPGFHRMHFDNSKLTLTLLFGDAAEALPQLATSIDAVYLDGFAPSRNPDLWSPALLALITRRCKSQATLATWSIAGAVRRTLEQIGWHLERRPGFAGKREMLRGLRVNAVSTTPTLGKSNTPHERRAIIIGAGLAGTAITERLTQRGWRVAIFERHATPAQEASGNPSGIVLPHMAKDDALAARLSRACYLYALRRYADLADICWSPCGVLQIARDADHEALQRATLLQLMLPEDFVAFLEKDAAEKLIGWKLAYGGWWFPGGGWVNPGSLCTALLDAGADLVERHFSTEISSLRQTENGWQVLDGAGDILACAPHVILANSCAANRLLTGGLPLTPIRGQISYLPEHFLEQLTPALRHVVCRSGYVTPDSAGTGCVGASFDRGDTDLNIRRKDHAGNLQRLDELLPGAAHGIDRALLSGRVSMRAATPDRLPMIGTLPDTDSIAPGVPTLDSLPRRAGLHALLGLSARGMVWAPLAAELLASQLEGDPLPLERDLAKAVDPARFHLRTLRRTKTVSRRNI